MGDRRVKGLFLATIYELGQGVEKNNGLLSASLKVISFLKGSFYTLHL
jgi:hypothetical protein